MSLQGQVAIITGASSGIGRGVRFMLEQPPHVSIPKMMVLPSEQAM